MADNTYTLDIGSKPSQGIDSYIVSHIKSFFGSPPKPVTPKSFDLYPTQDGKECDYAVTDKFDNETKGHIDWNPYNLPDNATIALSQGGKVVAEIKASDLNAAKKDEAFSKNALQLYVDRVVYQSPNYYGPTSFPPNTSFTDFVNIVKQEKEKSARDTALKKAMDQAEKYIAEINDIAQKENKPGLGDLTKYLGNATRQASDMDGGKIPKPLEIVAAAIKDRDADTTAKGR